jgi:hypothetical protein
MAVERTYAPKGVTRRTAEHREPLGGGLWMEEEFDLSDLLSVLVLAPTENWRSVRVADGIAPDNDWFVSYVATFGLRPRDLALNSFRAIELRRE